MDVDEDGQVRDGEGRADFNEHHVDVIDLTGDVDDNLKKLTEREQPESMDMDKIPQHPVKPEPSGTTAIKDEDSSRSPWASEIQLVRFRAMSEQVAESYLKKRNIRQSVDVWLLTNTGTLIVKAGRTAARLKFHPLLLRLNLQAPVVGLPEVKSYILSVRPDRRPSFYRFCATKSLPKRRRSMPRMAAIRHIQIITQIT